MMPVNPAAEDEDSARPATGTTRTSNMRLSIGPIQYFWPRERVEKFYEGLAKHSPLVIYLGETVCSKRRELDRDAWIALARMLADHGHEVIVSTLSLIEAGSELGAVITAAAAAAPAAPIPAAALTIRTTASVATSRVR